MELNMDTSEDQWLPVCKPHKDKHIEEIHIVGKFAFKYDFEESMYIAVLLIAWAKTVSYNAHYYMILNNKLQGFSSHEPKLQVMMLLIAWA